jgi:hypothetical protein
MKKLYLLNIDNGLSYDDTEHKSLVCSAYKNNLLLWIDQHPITAEIYKKIFGYALQDYAFPEYFIVEIASID